MYKHFDTGNEYTLDELKEVYRLMVDGYDTRYDSFYDWLDAQLEMGRNRIGGLVEVEA